MREEISKPRERRAIAGYAAWSSIAIVGSLAIGGGTPENVTRLLVLAFLGIQLRSRGLASRWLRGAPPRRRFMSLGLVLASVVEGLHMISKPVFETLVVRPSTGALEAGVSFAIDLAFTLPAYIVILGVIWSFTRRFNYSALEYALVMGLGQTLGDGGLFFFASAPAMLVFLPYPMTNYHAMNVLPRLVVKSDSELGRERSWKRFLAIPALIAVYFAAGASIKALGRAAGLDVP